MVAGTKEKESISAENNASSKSLEHGMALNLYFAYTFHSVEDIIFSTPQIKPLDGLIKAFIVVPITWVFISSQLIIANFHIMINKTKKKSKQR